MIPNAPTDNLYKFVTVLGVALMIFCAWSSTEAVKRVDNGTLDQLLRDVKDGVERATAEMDVEMVKELAHIPSSQRTEEQKAAINQALDRAFALLENQLKRLTEELRPAMLLKQGQNELLMYRLGTAIGGIIAAIGITAWYFLHQRYQDALLRRQVSPGETATRAVQND